jgi:hypothetical protein
MESVKCMVNEVTVMQCVEPIQCQCECIHDESVVQRSVV